MRLSAQNRKVADGVCARETVKERAQTQGRTDGRTDEPEAEDDTRVATHKLHKFR